MNSIVLRGTITAEQPISYTVPGEAAKSLTGGLNFIGGKPILTASGIRGKLRHSVSEAISLMLPEKLSLQSYLLLAQGGIMDAGSASKKKKKDDVDDAPVPDSIVAHRRAAEKNPVVSLFGSMMLKVAGKLYCGHAIAMDMPRTFRLTGSDDDIANDRGRGVVEISHVRSDVTQRDSGLFDRLSGDAIERHFERKAKENERSAKRKEKQAMLRELRRAQAANATPADIDALKAKVDALQAELDELDAVAAAHPGLAYMAIPQGTRFSHEMMLDRVSPLEIGVFLLALRAWSARPYFGGHLAHGMGRISGHWTVHKREPNGPALEPCGSVVLDSARMALDIEGALLDGGYEAALREAIRDNRLDFTVEGLIR